MSSPPTWLIVGLGNPGQQYARTRHNVGFMVIDTLARCLPNAQDRRRFDAVLRETTGPAGRLVLLKPQTFMNRSGMAVRPAMHWYKLRPEHVLVIYDELDLPFGQLRLRPSGSSAGHNGIKSIISQLGTDDFPRLRVGVGRPRGGNSVGYVLSRFSQVEAVELPRLLSRAADAVLSWQADGIDAAMNAYNRRVGDPEP